jgi:hypothetical protein
VTGLALQRFDYAPPATRRGTDTAAPREVNAHYDGEPPITMGPRADLPSCTLQELGTPSTVMDDQMGHADGSVQARYAHATADMVRRLVDGLTAVWEQALDARRMLSPGSPVAVLDRMLREKIVSQNSPQGDPLTGKDRSALRDTGPDLLFYGRADRI